MYDGLSYLVIDASLDGLAADAEMACKLCATCAVDTDRPTTLLLCASTSSCTATSLAAAACTLFFFCKSRE